MGRLVALDLGRRRCGIAATDRLQLVANGLTTVPSANLVDFLKAYLASEPVDLFIVGKPVTLSGEPSDSWRYIEPLLNRLKKSFPTMTFQLVDERFTSTLAHRAMLESGMKKSHRQIKENADTMAAAIMLNDYLESRKFNQQ